MPRPAPPLLLDEAIGAVAERNARGREVSLRRPEAAVQKHEDALRRRATARTSSPFSSDRQPTRGGHLTNLSLPGTEALADGQKMAWIATFVIGPPLSLRW